MQTTPVYVNKIQYLNRCGAKHHLEPSKRITNCTQGLQFRCRDYSYLGRYYTRIKEQPLKWRASSMMISCPKKQIPMLTRWGDFILRQRIRISIPKTSSKRSRAGQLEWMMLGSAAYDKSTTTSTRFFSSGSRSICTRLSARWHQEKVAVWTEEENHEMGTGGEGTDTSVRGMLHT